MPREEEIKKKERKNLKERRILSNVIKTINSDQVCRIEL